MTQQDFQGKNMTSQTILAHGASYEKLTISIRYWMLGKGYHRALAAMEFASQYHKGVRKDGTPEFSHQVWQAHYARSIIDSVMDPEGLLVTIFLHDVVEDYNVPLMVIESRFGLDAALDTDGMSKVVEGVKKDIHVYFAELAKRPNSSLAKGIDRIHNSASMVGAFTREKQLSYIMETRDYILPMLKSARRRFTHQENAYENVKCFLMGQISLIESFQDPQVLKSFPQPA